MSYIMYTPQVEVPQKDEDAQSAKVIEIMRRATAKNFDNHRHAIRGAHAKIHGCVVGTLEVHADLPAHLAQGVFATPRKYPVILRLSSAPGDIRDDSIPVPHGMAIKIIGVPGPKLWPEGSDAVTQDFVMVSLPTIPFGDVSKYLKAQGLIDKQTASPDRVQHLTADFAHRTNEVLSHFGIQNSAIEGLGVSNDHILGQTFHTMAAVRYGDYIAKLSVAPSSPSVKTLIGQRIDTHGNPSKLRDLVEAFFREQGAEYEMRAQLCSDLTAMPVEDASVLWDEASSPHQVIATVSIPPQEAYSPARRVYSDDVLSFSPWHAIEEHRPLGSIMRIRKQAYESSSKFRHEMNVQQRVEPRDISEVPD
ncbi:catalase family protein [Microbacterium sp. KSW4-16]|uniref:catalase family protein n=1 Tax=Microbacterium aurugineum TaxID=2851642 RepID=UPI0020C0A04C|nr:catalase family protein [Microbacterium aurugineum]MCK8469058.1 catalase family protein [Microbacterium aurugineum]